MLHCFYFFDGELIAHDKKRVLTLTVRTFLCVLNSGVCLLAVLTERDRGKRFDLEFGFLQKLGLLARVQPEIGQVIGDDTADLADLQGYGADCRQVLLRGELFNSVNDVDYRTYDDEFTGSVTAASAILSPLIPPSLNVVIYVSITGASIMGMFMTGLCAGIMWAIVMMLMLRLAKAMLPWMLALFFCALIVAFFPRIVMWLPHLMGYV